MNCKNCQEEVKLFDFKCKKCNEYQYINIFIVAFLGIWLLCSCRFFMDDKIEDIKDIFTCIVSGFLVPLFFYIYWSPTLVSIYRKHNNKIAIGCVNVFLVGRL